MHEHHYKQISSKSNMSVDFDVREEKGWIFSLDEALLWIMDSCILARSNG